MYLCTYNHAYLLGGIPPSTASTTRVYNVDIVSTSNIISTVTDPVALSMLKLPACETRGNHEYNYI